MGKNYFYKPLDTSYPNAYERKTDTLREIAIRLKEKGIENLLVEGPLPPEDMKVDVGQNAVTLASLYADILSSLSQQLTHKKSLPKVNPAHLDEDLYARKLGEYEDNISNEYRRDKGTYTRRQYYDEKEDPLDKIKPTPNASSIMIPDENYLHYEESPQDLLCTRDMFLDTIIRNINIIADKAEDQDSLNAILKPVKMLFATNIFNAAYFNNQTPEPNEYRHPAYPILILYTIANKAKSQKLLKNVVKTVKAAFKNKPMNDGHIDILYDVLANVTTKTNDSEILFDIVKTVSGSLNHPGIINSETLKHAYRLLNTIAKKTSSKKILSYIAQTVSKDNPMNCVIHINDESQVISSQEGIQEGIELINQKVEETRENSEDTPNSIKIIGSPELSEILQQHSEELSFEVRKIKILGSKLCVMDVFPIQETSNDINKEKSEEHTQEQKTKQNNTPESSKDSKQTHNVADMVSSSDTEEKTQSSEEKNDVSDKPSTDTLLKVIDSHMAKELMEVAVTFQDSIAQVQDKSLGTPNEGTLATAENLRKDTIIKLIGLAVTYQEAIKQAQEQEANKGNSEAPQKPVLPILPQNGSKGSR